MRGFSIPLTVRSAQYVAPPPPPPPPPRVIPQKVTSHQNRQLIPVRGEQAFTLAKNQWKTGGVKNTHTLRRWVFRFGFFAVFRGSCLVTRGVGGTSILKVTGTCRWTGYEFAVINISTGYLVPLFRSSILAQGI